jgi:hypothetical protein
MRVYAERGKGLFDKAYCRCCVLVGVDVSILLLCCNGERQIISVTVLRSLLHTVSLLHSKLGHSPNMFIHVSFEPISTSFNNVPFTVGHIAWRILPEERADLFLQFELVLVLRCDRDHGTYSAGSAGAVRAAVAGARTRALTGTHCAG